MRTALLALVVVLLTLSAVAAAQGGSVEGIVVGPGGLCLDLDGTFSAARPPPVGTAVVLSPCDGSDDQRWSYAYGDYNGDFYALGWMPIVHRAGVVVTGGRHVDSTHARFVGDGPIEIGGGCLTASTPPGAGQPLRVAPCTGAPNQHFVMR